MGCRRGQSERVSGSSCGVSRDDGNAKWLARSFRAGHTAARLPSRVKGLIEMLDKNLEDKRAPGVDERLARVVRIIVEQYDGDVKAFVESNRYKTEVNRKAEAASDHGDEAA